MIPGKKYTPQDALRIALRRKWIIAVPIVVAAVGVAGLLHTMPDRYWSETLILVVPQRVPESYVRSTVTARVEDRARENMTADLGALFDQADAEIKTRLGSDLFETDRRGEPMADRRARALRDEARLPLLPSDRVSGRDRVRANRESVRGTPGPALQHHRGVRGDLTATGRARAPKAVA